MAIPTVRQPETVFSYTFRPKAEGETDTEYLIQYFSTAQTRQRIILPHGTYYVRREDLPANVKLRDYFMLVDERQDIVFDGGGSKIICDDPRTFLEFRNCNRVVAQCFRLKFHLPVASFGVCANYRHRGSIRTFTNRKVTSALQWSDNSPRRDRWKVDNSKWWRQSDDSFPFDHGESVVARHYEVEGHGFLARGGNNVTFRNNHIYSWPGMGFSFVDVGFGAAVIDNTIGVDPESPKEFVSCTRDGAHFNGCGFNIVVTGNHFSDHGDDSLNIHGRFATVRNVDGSTVQAEFTNGFGTRFLVPLTSGERVEARSPNLKFKHRSRLAGEVSRSGFVYHIPLLNTSGIEPGDVLEFPDRLGNRFYIAGNTFENNFGRGMLVSSRNGVIEHNVLRNQTANAIRIGPDLGWYNSAGCSHFIEIRHNLIEGGCQQAEVHANASRFRGAIAVGSQIKAPGWEAEGDIHSFIRVTQNTLRGIPGVGIQLRSAKASIVEGNVFQDVGIPHDWEHQTQPGPPDLRLTDVH